MPAFGPIKRWDLIRFLRRLGLEGLFSGGKHGIMPRSDNTLAVLNPHQKDIARGLLARILRQAGISRVEWE